MTAKTILLIGTLDTKGNEFAFVRDLIHQRGHQTLVINAGVTGSPAFQPDISAEQVAEAAGTALDDLKNKGDRGYAIEIMSQGAEQITKTLYQDKKIDGVLGLGGSAGTLIGTSAMRALPAGVPKVMVSTLASGDTTPYVGEKDITMMYSIVDIAGINRISRMILANAAGAVCGMVEQDTPAGEDKPIIAATMFGVTTPCVTTLRERLEKEGFEVVVFHATGSGGRAMESLIAEGFIDAVADITTTEWCDELVGGVLNAGPQRLEAAVRKGIPQVVSCGALDMVNFWAIDTVPEKYKKRNLYKHNPNVTLMRTTKDECAELGEIMAEKLNQATAPTVLMLPLKGVSAIDKAGQPFYDPEADQALFDSLRKHIQPPVELVELDLHINDPEFAQAAAERLMKLIHTMKS